MILKVESSSDRFDKIHPKRIGAPPPWFVRAQQVATPFPVRASFCPSLCCPSAPPALHSGSTKQPPSKHHDQVPSLRECLAFNRAPVQLLACHLAAFESTSIHSIDSFHLHLHLQLHLPLPSSICCCSITTPPALGSAITQSSPSAVRSPQPAVSKAS